MDSAYDVSLTGRGPVGDERCRQGSAHARDRAPVWAEVFVGPDTTVFHVEDSQSLQVFSEYLGIDTTGSCPPAVSCC